MLVCVHEDRASALVGVKLLVLSLKRHCPDLRIVVSAPSAPDEFVQWCAGELTVILRTHRPGTGTGWNVKPSLLLDLLDQGHEEVVWLDSDIALAGDFRPLLYTCEAETLVVSQAQYWDIYQRGTTRTELWNLTPGRPLPFLVSSGFIRVTEHHRPLLEAWQDLLQTPAYIRAQARTLYRRPVHMLGDQDVLTALLASDQFAHVPMMFLKRGRDIILTVGPAGYTIGERLTSLWHRRSAPLIHIGGVKPWELPLTGRSRYYERVYQETSPYAWVARPYARKLGEVMVGLQPRTLAARVMRAVTFDHPAMQGFPQAVHHTAMRRLKRLMGKTAWPTPQANVDGEVALAAAPMPAFAAAETTVPLAEGATGRA